jgi:ubiquinone/menaquinone biosynthesis C-methylase UbiE
MDDAVQRRSDDPTSAHPSYALPRTQEEYDRLGRQAAFLGGTTERLFRAAGLAPGMRILDVGSGAGDVTFLAADMVGPDGEVVGVDVDGDALDLAAERARAAGRRNVTFVHGDAHTVDPGGDFDAIVGRLVLMYSGDPVETVRRLMARVRRGGLVAFQELDLDPTGVAPSLPRETLWTEVGELVVETFARAGMQMRMGMRLFRAFVDAGLPGPVMLDEAVVGGGPEFGGYGWLAGVTRGLAPVMAKLGLADVEALDLDTLADRLREDAVSARAVVWTPPLVGAYARTPES